MQTQRSCDYFLGVPFNIASYSLLVYMMCHVLNNSNDCPYKYTPGKLVMNLGDYHLYEEHVNQARKQILRIPENREIKIKNIDYQIYQTLNRGYDCFFDNKNGNMDDVDENTKKYFDFIVWITFLYLNS